MTQQHSQRPTRTNEKGSKPMPHIYLGKGPRDIVQERAIRRLALTARGNDRHRAWKNTEIEAAKAYITMLTHGTDADLSNLSTGKQTVVQGLFVDACVREPKALAYATLPGQREEWYADRATKAKRWLRNNNSTPRTASAPDSQQSTPTQTAQRNPGGHRPRRPQRNSQKVTVVTS